MPAPRSAYALAGACAGEPAAQRPAVPGLRHPVTFRQLRHP
ncbi:hypothetical protein [Micromonospora sp. M71_S20]|nr:hypothetical protein [Micromonospora sp. M71_S20]